MGNICGKADKDDPFDQPGRTLGSGRPTTIPSSTSTQQQPKTVGIPAKTQAQKVGGPARTLGGSSGGGGGSVEDARRKAAEAAEARNAPKATGKLGSKLEAQKRESRMDTLKKASENEVRQREIDAKAQAASHN